MNKEVRTRFAPSPTGYLHVGGARTALYNWLYARKNNGKFVLRIEDTDIARSTQKSTEAILEAMKWLGLNWDEGPYYQSKRLDLYNTKLEKLRKKGVIYPAFETREELDIMRNFAQKAGKPPIYNRRALELSDAEIERKMGAGEQFVWRFKVPDNQPIDLKELLMGGTKTQFNTNALGDFIITRPGTNAIPGMPLYNFVCAVDDADMGITHVIRGVEHLSNAARQALLCDALEVPQPDFVHLPIVMKNNKKMSKRDEDPDGLYPVSVLDRAARGYVPEATLNHLALLGWSHPDNQEILSIEEMVSAFSLERLNRSNANFDEQKYHFFNSHYISKMPNDRLLSHLKPFMAEFNLPLNDYTQPELEKIIGLEKERCKTLDKFPESLDYFFIPPTEYDAKGQEKTFFRDKNHAIFILDIARTTIESIETLNKQNIDTSLQQAVNQSNITYKEFGSTLRLAITGKTKSPGLSEMIEIMGKDRIILRIETARRFIQKPEPHLIGKPTDLDI